MRWVLLSTSLLWILCGCQGSLTAPLELGEQTRYQPPELSALIATTPAPLLVGDAAAFDGWLLSGDDWRRIKDDRARLVQALAEAYEQRADDVRLAETEDRAKREALRQCRQRKAEVLALGVALGVGGCSAVERAAGAIAPQQ